MNGNDSWCTVLAGAIRGFASAVAAASVLTAWQNAEAQYYHNHHHHHHHVGSGYGAPIARDGAGHLVDSRGHHVDQYGRHTGTVGVYANGAYAPTVYGSPQIYSGAPGYGNVYGNASSWNPGVPTPNLGTIPANNIPPNVVPGWTSGGSGKVLITNLAESG
ncbi:MAG TPA: hypothetical protein VGM98_11510, partial [Schlesneria sp.]